MRSTISNSPFYFNWYFLIPIYSIEVNINKNKCFTQILAASTSPSRKKIEALYTNFNKSFHTAISKTKNGKDQCCTSEKNCQ